MVPLSVDAGGRRHRLPCQLSAGLPYHSLETPVIGHPSIARLRGLGWKSSLCMFRIAVLCTFRPVKVGLPGMSGGIGRDAGSVHWSSCQLRSHRPGEVERLMRWHVVNAAQTVTESLSLRDGKLF